MTDYEYDDAEEPIFDDEPRRRLEDDPLARLALPIGRSPWAIIAGYLGLLSFVFFPAPLAFIVSLVAIRDIRRNPKRRGLGRAIFGLIMGVIGSIGLAFVIWALIHNSGRPG